MKYQQPPIIQTLPGVWEFHCAQCFKSIEGALSGEKLFRAIMWAHTRATRILCAECRERTCAICDVTKDDNSELVALVSPPRKVCRQCFVDDGVYP